jgi:hypothetical protein
MDKMLTDHKVSLVEFIRHPNKVMSACGGQPITVISSGRPLFYALPPALFYGMLELIEDYELSELARQRLGTEGDITYLEIDEI